MGQKGPKKSKKWQNEGGSLRYPKGNEHQEFGNVKRLKIKMLVFLLGLDVNIKFQAHRYTPSYLKNTAKVFSFQIAFFPANKLTPEIITYLTKYL